MTRAKKILILRLPGTVVFSLFVLAVVWVLIPLGGATLPHLIADRLEMPFLNAVLLVSVASGVLGAGTICAMAFWPSMILARWRAARRKPSLS